MRLIFALKYNILSKKKHPSYIQGQLLFYISKMKKYLLQLLMMMQLLVMCSLNAMAQKGDSAVNTPQQPAPTAQVVDTTLVKGLESMEDATLSVNHNRFSQRT